MSDDHLQQSPHGTPHDDRSTSPYSQTQGGAGSDASDSGMSAVSDTEMTMHQPIPVRPRLPSRKSSGPLVVPRDSSAVGPIDAHFGPDDVRAMSPRRTSEDIDRMGRAARDEMRRHAKLMQDSLMTIFNRIEAVKDEHDKLNNNNKFLQKYIGDLMSTSKITATGSSSRVKK
jgi:hypothetical protein